VLRIIKLYMLRIIFENIANRKSNKRSNCKIQGTYQKKNRINKEAEMQPVLFNSLRFTSS